MRKIPTIVFIVVAVMIFSFLAAVLNVGLADKNGLSFNMLVWTTVCFLMLSVFGLLKKKQ